MCYISILLFQRMLSLGYPIYTLDAVNFEAALVAMVLHKANTVPITNGPLFLTEALMPGFLGGPVLAPEKEQKTGNPILAGKNT